MKPGNDHRRPTPFDDESLRHVLEFLIDLREKSDPVGAETTEPRKHSGSLEAILYTGLLVETLCGWAFDHQIGIAKEGFSKVPSLGEADDHRFEISGRSHQPGNPTLDRKILADCVVIGGVVPFAFRDPLRRALQALNAGETLDLVRPAPTGMWGSPFSLAELRFLAVNHVFLRWGAGIKKKKAREDVAACLGVSPATLRTWETTWLPRVKGTSLRRIFAIAKSAGKISRWLEEHPWQLPADRAAHAHLMHLNANPIEEIADAHRQLQKQASSKRR